MAASSSAGGANDHGVECFADVRALLGQVKATVFGGDEPTATYVGHIGDGALDDGSVLAVSSGERHTQNLA